MVREKLNVLILSGLSRLMEIIIRNFTNESFTVDTLASEMALESS